MVVLKDVDRLSFDLSCESIGTEWFKSTKPSCNDEDNINVVLADNASLRFALDTLTITCEGLETEFDVLDFDEVIIT